MQNCALHACFTPIQSCDVCIDIVSTWKEVLWMGAYGGWVRRGESANDNNVWVIRSWKGSISVSSGRPNSSESLVKLNYFSSLKLHQSKLTFNWDTLGTKCENPQYTSSSPPYVLLSSIVGGKILKPDIRASCFFLLSFIPNLYRTGNI